METTSPASLKHAATGGRETKAKAPNKVSAKEEKGVKTAKRQGRCKNLKERKDATVVAHQLRVAAQLAWEMQVKANTQACLLASRRPWSTSMVNGCALPSRRSRPQPSASMPMRRHWGMTITH
jgi:hypothetical protein